jgi:hypothetical protein
MMPRPLYRRVSFWLGLFVACFLAWECLANRGKVMIASFPGGGGDQVHLVRVRGNSYLMWGETIGIANFVSQWVDFARFEDNGFDWEAHWDGKGAFGARYLKLPDEVVFLCYLGLWVGWMAWWWQRGRKLEGMKESC